MQVLRVKGLTKVYGSRYAGAVATAIDGMDFTVNQGEFVSIMGPSGSGKTTLLNMLAGIDRPTSGEIVLQGKDMTQLSSDELAVFRRRSLGFVFQDYNLLDTLTVRENIALPLALDGQSGSESLRRIDEVLMRLGMAEYAMRYPCELSGGQQQRTAVARAVVHKPALVLADEPTGNLDSGSAQSLLEIFQEMHGSDEGTILMVTHDPYAASYSQRIVFIKDGQIFSRLSREGSRQSFFQEILNHLAVLEGAR